MKTCKDCLHYEICKVFNRNIGNSPIEDYCAGFTDRSEWVHKPCKVGETVYEVRNITCACYSCVRYDVFNEYCECEEVDCPLTAKLPVCSKQHLEIVTYTADNDFILHHIADFGKTVFLTCKEAEKALERMKEND